jgi:hypothetical protein
MCVDRFEDFTAIRTGPHALQRDGNSTAEPGGTRSDL